jgi:hypothetical protein
MSTAHHKRFLRDEDHPSAPSQPKPTTEAIDTTAIASFHEEKFVGASEIEEAIGQPLVAVKKKRTKPQPATGVKVDAYGRKWNGRGWGWIKHDLNELQRLVTEAGDQLTIDFDDIGKRMIPVRGASVCKTMANNKKMIKKTDAYGRRLTGTGWSWINRDHVELERLLAETADTSSSSSSSTTDLPISVIDWGAIGRQMIPVRAASACQSMANRKNKENIKKEKKVKQIEANSVVDSVVGTSHDALDVVDEVGGGDLSYDTNEMNPPAKRAKVEEPQLT